MRRRRRPRAFKSFAAPNRSHYRYAIYFIRCRRPHRAQSFARSAARRIYYAGDRIFLSYAYLRPADGGGAINYGGVKTLIPPARSAERWRCP